MQLYRYQREAVSWLSTKPKAFLALDQGLGKTAVSAVDAIAPVYVICPATLKINWAREFAIWRPDLKVKVISNSKDKADSNCDVNIINYDIVSKITAPPYRTLICDESHYLKTGTAKRTKYCVGLIKRAERVRLLSGTPVVNRPIELYPTLKAIGGTKLDYINFGRRYCSGWQTPWGSFDVSGSSNLDELYDKLSNCLYRVTKASALPELPSKTYRVIEFDCALSVKEKALLKSAISKPDFSVPFQAIPDILKLNAQKKLPLVIEHIKTVLQHEKKVVVFGWHTDIINALEDSLREYGTVKIIGGVSQNARQKAVDEFQSGDARVFLGNIRAAGVGLTLTASNYVIFAETTWTPAELHQAADRCHRIGQKNHVQVDILTIEKSIDSIQLHLILGKTEVIENIIKENHMENSEIKSRLAVIAKEIAQLSLELDGPVAEQVAEQVAEPITKKKISIDDVRKVVRGILESDNEDRIAIVQTNLKEFGAARLSDLEPAHYGEFLQTLEA